MAGVSAEDVLTGVLPVVIALASVSALDIAADVKLSLSALLFSRQLFLRVLGTFSVLHEVCELNWPGTSSGQ